MRVKRTKNGLMGGIKDFPHGGDRPPWGEQGSNGPDPPYSPQHLVTLSDKKTYLAKVDESAQIPRGTPFPTPSAILGSPGFHFGFLRLS